MMTNEVFCHMWLVYVLLFCVTRGRPPDYNAIASGSGQLYAIYESFWNKYMCLLA